jgi:hypothetical protein
LRLLPFDGEVLLIIAEQRAPVLENLVSNLYVQIARLPGGAPRPFEPFAQLVCGSSGKMAA